MLSISCLPAAFFSGAGPFSPFTWCLSTSQDASDVQLLNLIRASFLHPVHQLPAPLLCDVVAQTVKVNHSGLYIYMREKKNTSVCLCRCTNLLSKQNHSKPWQKKSTKVSERKWRRMCLGFFLVFSWMMDVLWCPQLHPPPPVCPASLWRGRSSSLSLSDWMGVVNEAPLDFFGETCRVLFTERSSLMYINFSGEDYVSILYVCWREI